MDTTPQWIDRHAQPPDPALERILVWDTDGARVDFAWWDAGQWRSTDPGPAGSWGTYEPIAFRYWMPLPPPPPES